MVSGIAGACVTFVWIPRTHPTTTKNVDILLRNVHFTKSFFFSYLSSSSDQ